MVRADYVNLIIMHRGEIIKTKKSNQNCIIWGVATYPYPPPPSYQNVNQYTLGYTKNPIFWITDNRPPEVVPFGIGGHFKTLSTF